MQSKRRYAPVPPLPSPPEKDIRRAITSLRPRPPPLPEPQSGSAAAAAAEGGNEWPSSVLPRQINGLNYQCHSAATSARGQ